MIYQFLAITLFAVACGPKSTPVELGKTTKAALLESKGVPGLVETPLGESGPELFVYENDEKFQINKAEIVEASFRLPTMDERILLHWRHKLQSCDTEFVAMSEGVGDQRPLMELRCRARGIVVVYDPNVDQVIRVVEHAR